MPQTISMKDLLEAGVHFGHQSKRWNPKMKPYIFTARNGVHVIDLAKTAPMLEEAYNFIKDVAANNGTIVFVGSKKQARHIVTEEAKRVGAMYITERCKRFISWSMMACSFLVNFLSSPESR